MRILFAILIAVSVVPCQILPAATIIHAGRFIDGRSDEMQTEVSIVVDGGKISEVVKGFINPAEGDRLIDLSKQIVMPGLMDMHTHLIGQHSKDAYTEKFFMEESDYALRSTVYARATLMAGFTTVRELGDNGIIGEPSPKAGLSGLGSTPLENRSRPPADMPIPPMV